MTAKPDFSEGLGRVWGVTGTSVDPDTVTAGKVATGWIQEKPPFAYMNWLQKFVTQFVNHVNEEGIALWDAETTYPTNGLTKGADGVVYRAISSNTNVDPTVTPATWSVFASGGGGTSDDISNESGVSGATVTAALNALNALISGLDSGDISNASGVTGADVTAALNALNSALVALDSSDIVNASSLVGATITSALDGLDSGDISNASGVTGATVTTALTTLNAAIASVNATVSALGSDDISNDSTVAGATVSDALEQLDSDIASAGGTTLVSDMVTSDATIPNTARVEYLAVTLQPNTNYAFHGEIIVNGQDANTGTYSFGVGSVLITDASMRLRHRGLDPGDSAHTYTNWSSGAGFIPSTTVPNSDVDGAANQLFSIAGHVRIGATGGEIGLGSTNQTGASSIIVRRGSHIVFTPIP